VSIVASDVRLDTTRHVQGINAMSRYLLSGVLLAVWAISPVPAVVPQDTLTFAVTLTTGPAWLADRAPNDQPHMRLHSQNLGRLRAEGRAVLGGRYGAFGLVLIRAPDSAAVAQMFAPDSAVQTGVFSIRIDRWRTFYDGCVE
jgi:hypothetical protein